jgi:hypothetical protein
MQPQARRIHVVCECGLIKQRQDQAQPGRMDGLNPSRTARDKGALQSVVRERLDYVRL